MTDDKTRAAALGTFFTICVVGLIFVTAIVASCVKETSITADCRALGRFRTTSPRVNPNDPTIYTCSGEKQ